MSADLLTLRRLTRAGVIDRKQAQKITTEAQLKKAIRNGTLEASLFITAKPGRISYEDATAIANPIITKLEARFPRARVTACGSLRRKSEFVKDIDLLIDDPRAMDYFKSLGQVVEDGDKKAAILVNGWMIELRTCRPEVWGTFLIHLTGSKEFNANLRRLANKEGMTLNEYSLTWGDRELQFPQERAVFDFLGLEYTFPEER